MAATHRRGGHDSSSAAAAALCTVASRAANSNCSLLHAIETLQDSVWADLLLPMLVVQGSASNCALSCKQMRQLCHSQAAALKIAARECFLPSATLARVTEHFPACSSVLITIDSKELAAKLQPELVHLSRCVTCCLSISYGQQQTYNRHLERERRAFTLMLMLLLSRASLCITALYAMPYSCTSPPYCS